jgi:Ca2+/H+ antiporter
MIREYGILVFGFPMRVILWILIAMFLGLIFSMLQWPTFWRKMFDRKHKENIEARKQSTEDKAKKAAEHSKKVAVILLWVVGIAIALLAIFYAAGMWS